MYIYCLCIISVIDVCLVCDGMFMCVCVCAVILVGDHVFTVGILSCIKNKSNYSITQLLLSKSWYGCVHNMEIFNKVVNSNQTTQSYDDL